MSVIKWLKQVLGLESQKEVSDRIQAKFDIAFKR